MFDSNKQLASQLKREIQNHANQCIEYITNEKNKAKTEIRNIVAEVEQYAQQMKEQANDRIDSIVSTLDNETTEYKNNFISATDRKQSEVNKKAESFIE